MKLEIILEDNKKRFKKDLVDIDKTKYPVIYGEISEEVNYARLHGYNMIVGGHKTLFGKYVIKVFGESSFVLSNYVSDLVKKFSNTDQKEKENLKYSGTYNQQHPFYQ